MQLEYVFAHVLVILIRRVLLDMGCDTGGEVLDEPTGDAHRGVLVRALPRLDLHLEVRVLGRLRNFGGLQGISGRAQSRTFQCKSARTLK